MRKLFFFVFVAICFFQQVQAQAPVAPTIIDSTISYVDILGDSVNAWFITRSGYATNAWAIPSIRTMSGAVVATGDTVLIGSPSNAPQAHLFAMGNLSLQANTQYKFWVIGSNIAGTHSDTLSFWVPGPPTITSVAPSLIGPATVKVSVGLTPGHTNANLQLRWGYVSGLPSPNIMNMVVSTTGTYNFVFNALADTTVYFRVYGSNALTTVTSTVMSIQTQQLMNSEFVSISVSDPRPDSVVLRVIANQGDHDTAWVTATVLPQGGSMFNLGTQRVVSGSTLSFPYNTLPSTHLDFYISLRDTLPSQDTIVSFVTGQFPAPVITNVGGLISGGNLTTSVNWGGVSGTVFSNPGLLTISEGSQALNVIPVTGSFNLSGIILDSLMPFMNHQLTFTLVDGLGQSTSATSSVLTNQATENPGCEVILLGSNLNEVSFNVKAKPNGNYSAAVTHVYLYENGFPAGDWMVSDSITWWEDRTFGPFVDQHSFIPGNQYQIDVRVVASNGFDVIGSSDPFTVSPVGTLEKIQVTLTTVDAKSIDVYTMNGGFVRSINLLYGQSVGDAMSQVGLPAGPYAIKAIPRIGSTLVWGKYLVR